MAIDVAGTTVLITGASAGLGVEFAHRFAARGANLVLVARRADRLEALATELRGAHGIIVTVLPADLAAPGVGASLHQELTNRGITVNSLINNAGFGTHGAFVDEDLERVTSEIQLNIATLVELTHTFLPDLLTGRGTLVNIASTASFQPTPGMAVLRRIQGVCTQLHRSALGRSSRQRIDCIGGVPRSDAHRVLRRSRLRRRSGRANADGNSGGGHRFPSTGSTLRAADRRIGTAELGVLDQHSLRNPPVGRADFRATVG